MMPFRFALPLAVLLAASTAHAADPASPAAAPASAPPAPVAAAPVAPAPLAAEPAAAEPAAAAPAAPPPAHQELIDQGEATRILGRTVLDPAGDEVGRIVDLLIDDQGVPRAALIDFGGFMGVGNRRIAVAWRAIKFLPAAQQHQIRLDMTADQIKATPDYKPARPDSPPVTMAVPPPAPVIAKPGTPAPEK